MIHWEKITKAESKVITQIAKRAFREFPKAYPDEQHLQMNVAAVHLSDGLDLQKLLNADMYTFAHDIHGIDKHLNKTTGKLERGFLPRCYKARKKSGLGYK